MFRSARLLCGLLVCLASGCASIDFDYPKMASEYYQDTSNTYLHQQVTPILADKPVDQSGFHVLSNGIDALATRLLMAERAQKSIDAQYYLIKDDIVGKVFLDALLRAADRGVRVRLLLDDMFTGGQDKKLAALHAHPNFEIRIFNPFANRSARFIDGLTSFSRVNRRMHNKSFTVDNSVTIIGGRNIADEYFGVREDAKFGDVDVLAIGPLVTEVSASFDTYWNHQRALPLPAFLPVPDNAQKEIDKLRADREEISESLAESEYVKVLDAKVTEYINSSEDRLIWAPYELTVDSPDKSDRKKAASADSITTPLRASITSAEQELIIISPYFVPLNSGIDFLKGIEAKGVDIEIITNSLAANNQATVHGGYAPARKPLLKSGVRLYEVRADAEVSGAEYFAGSGAKATLHTKVFVVDRRELFIGSFNFDPRSVYINTEMGVIIRSPEIASAAAISINDVIAGRAYEVFLNEDEKIRWRSNSAEGEKVYDKEPDTTWWERFKAGVFRILPIKGQL